MLESNEFFNFIVVEDVDQIKGQVVNVGNLGLFMGCVDEGCFCCKVGVDGNNYELYEIDFGVLLIY